MLNKRTKFKKESLEEIKIAVQINGKTRDIIEMKKDQSESEVTKLVLKSSKAKKSRSTHHRRKISSSGTSLATPLVLTLANHNNFRGKGRELNTL